MMSLAAAAALLAAATSVSADSTTTVRPGPKEIVPIRTKTRFTTVITLPAPERVLDYVVGDRDAWVVEGAERFCYVKPTRERLSTNLALVTASGRVYSFVLNEVSGTDDKPQLNVFVEPLEDESPTPGLSETERLKQELQRAQLGQDTTRELRFAYKFDEGKNRPFRIEALYHDDNFTYLHVADGGEKPALYAVVDGEPSLVNFVLRDGIYIVPQVLDEGYLVLGKTKLRFQRRNKR